MNWPTPAPTFLLGVATSGHQVDGGEPNNDWTRWEEAGHTAEPSSPSAINHWVYFATDLAAFRELGANAYRFSLEWSRLEPEPGRYDPAAFDHYREMVAACRANGLEPLITISHFTLPEWLSQRGGWLSPDIGARFTALAAAAVTHLPTVRFWCTINEPNVLALMGYVEGVWPPGRHRPLEAVRALGAQLAAHRAAYRAIKQQQPDAVVGVAHHWIWFRPYSPAPVDRAAAWLADRLFNRAPVRCAYPQDFIGVNYYAPRWVRAKHLAQPSLVPPPTAVPGSTPHQTTDMGWAIDPTGLYAVVRAASRYHRPVIVTENGVATDDEATRAKFIMDHREALARARADGVDIRGYFYWSGLDNFEWVEGYRPHFGLIAVDRATGARSRKEGAAAFVEWARAMRADEQSRPPQ